MANKKTLYETRSSAAYRPAVDLASCGDILKVRFGNESAFLWAPDSRLQANFFKTACMGLLHKRMYPTKEQKLLQRSVSVIAEATTDSLDISRLNSFLGPPTRTLVRGVFKVSYSMRVTHNKFWIEY